MDANFQKEDILLCPVCGALVWWSMEGAHAGSHNLTAEEFTYAIINGYHALLLRQKELES